MSLPETFVFDNNGEVVRFPLVRKLFLSLVIVLTAGLAFGIGRLTTERQSGGVEINYKPELLQESSPVASAPAQTASVVSVVAPSTGSVYASSKGTKYYYTNCKSTIVEKNKVTFATAQMAEKAGYTLASGCKGP